MIMFRNFVANRDDMANIVRVLQETQWYYVSEWRSSEIVSAIRWHEEFNCQIKHIVPLDKNLINVVSDKNVGPRKETMILHLQNLHKLIPSSNLVL